MLRRCAQAAKEHDLLIHIHLSETAAEVENCLRERGKRPVHYLNDIGLLEARCVFAHGVHIDAGEMEVLQQKPVSISICTDSNLKLASGLAPIKAYLDHGINLSLGTDSVASNNDLDLLGELSTTAKLHKALNNDPAFLPAIEALKLVTINAARALGVEDRRGSLEIGKDADFLVIDTQSLNSMPIYEPASQLVYAINSRQIRDVFVAGKQVVKEQRLVNLDEAELLQTATRYATMIKEELSK
jgi:5-methylthioadenosine/S-adenosylhomocysteine deaminase